MPACSPTSAHGKRSWPRACSPIAACGCGTQPEAIRWCSMPMRLASGNWAGSSRTHCWSTRCGMHCRRPACACIARRGSTPSSHWRPACACGSTMACSSRRNWRSPPMARSPHCATWPASAPPATTTGRRAWSASLPARAAIATPAGNGSCRAARSPCCRSPMTATSPCMDASVRSSGPCRTRTPNACWRSRPMSSSANSRPRSAANSARCACCRRAPRSRCNGSWPKPMCRDACCCWAMPRMRCIRLPGRASTSACAMCRHCAGTCGRRRRAASTSPHRSASRAGRAPARARTR